MQFTTLAFAALSAAAVLAQDTKVHVVRVGAMNGSLAYFPNNLVAAVGDMVQFQFAPANHTVTQSTFDNPCSPIAQHSNVTGVFSGYMPVSASAEMSPTYTIKINSTTPMWLYCSQGKHCQNGMTMVINENTKANASRSLSAYQALAKGSTTTVVTPTTPATNGTAGTTTNTGDPSSTSSAGTASQTGNSAASVGVPAMAGLLAMGFALFI